ncbi:phage major capsid protein, P2 family [Guyparkeria sp. GHLCS8-2]|uniref:phage major capsid protein, P2 family n=1 Tax=Guyparkeria halopsychrophila TaxID=3139421 RepID=UPI0037C611C4
MKNTTRTAFNDFKAQIAQLNGVPDASTKFAASPAVEQTMINKMQESSDFLRRINIMGVDNQQGEKLGLGVGSTIAGTTDTSSTDRSTTDPTNLDTDGYMCTQTNFDTHLTYGKLDAWAHLLDFQRKVRDQILQRQRLDRIMIGFNGTSRAATSDRATNPLLQDVNKGWLQKLREFDTGSNVMDEGGTAGEIHVGTDGDYANLDALVFDIVNSLVDPWYRQDTGLVAILGRGLMVDKFFPLIESHGDTPTESNALDMMMSAKRIGGLQAVQLPFFPDRAVAVTRLDNLSIYLQNGSTRRAIIDKPERDRIEDYQSVNEAYVIEDNGGMALAENIKFTSDGGTTWA